MLCTLNLPSVWSINLSSANSAYKWQIAYYVCFRIKMLKNASKMNRQDRNAFAAVRPRPGELTALFQTPLPVSRTARHRSPTRSSAIDLPITCYFQTGSTGYKLSSDVASAKLTCFIAIPSQRVCLIVNFYSVEEFVTLSGTWAIGSYWSEALPQTKYQAWQLPRRIRLRYFC